MSRLPPSSAVSIASTLLVLVTSALVTFGAWLIAVVAAAPIAWVASLAWLPLLGLLATLFVLSRSAEHSLTD